jgi:glycine cleavage system aminomethyltransferase T
MTQIPSAGALKRTPLYDVHRKAGAKMVPFGGWEMPVQYTGIIEEHRTVRGAVGLFDISHMGEFEIAGPEALAIVQRLTTNDASVLAVGQVQYSLLCYPGGRHRGRPDALPPGQRPVHAHSQRVEHRQGLGVGHVSR